MEMLLGEGRVFGAGFLADCTPGYYNNEGRPAAPRHRPHRRHRLPRGPGRLLRLHGQVAHRRSVRGPRPPPRPELGGIDARFRALTPPSSARRVSGRRRSRGRSGSRPPSATSVRETMAVWTPASASARNRPTCSSTVAAPSCGRSSPGAIDRGLGQAGDGDLGRVAVDLGAVAVQDLDLAPDGLGVAEEVAGVGVPGHEPQRPPLARAADEDRHVLLEGPGVADRLRHGGGATLEAGRPLAPHERQQLEGVLQPVVALGDRRERPVVEPVLPLEPRPARGRPGPARRTGRRGWRRSSPGRRRSGT